MATEVADRPIKDCLGCRIVSSLGMVGIGGYIGQFAFKNKSLLGQLALSSFSFGFICLGVARYKQTYPFDRKEDKESL